VNFAALEYLPFLGLVVGIFPFVPRGWRTSFLLLASYVFYLAAVPWHGLLLLASTLLDYGVGLALGRTAGPRARRALLALSLVGNLGLLAWFKYGGFLARSASALGELLGLDALVWSEVLLPLGISFYTFQTLSYSLDVYRGRLEPERDLRAFALYVAFFPQLVAGPIERAGDLLPQLRAARPTGLADLGAGSTLILWGLLKKACLADRLAPLLTPIFAAPAQHSSAELAAAALLAMVRLYLDFSGYTDIARGSARLFGVQLVPNFERSFLVASNDQFWRRWHMSLGRWIADYVHAPLSRGRPSYLRIWVLDLLVMGLFGLWHGAEWNFVVLGLAAGVAVALEHSRALQRFRRGERRSGARPGPLQVVLGFAWTMALNAGLLVLFFVPDLPGALDYYGALWPRAGSEGWAAALALDPALAAALLWLPPLFAAHALLAQPAAAMLWTRAGPAIRVAVRLGLLGLFLRYRVPGAVPFVYFQF
jgi:alginate O-acetyltransferase complex protein AlgI